MYACFDGDELLGRLDLILYPIATILRSRRRHSSFSGSNVIIFREHETSGHQGCLSLRRRIAYATTKDAYFVQRDNNVTTKPGKRFEQTRNACEIRQCHPGPISRATIPNFLKFLKRSCINIIAIMSQSRFGTSFASGAA